MNTADEKVSRFILRDFRSNVGRGSTNDEQHLADCGETVAAHVEAEDGYYGCETGCEYARLLARIECPHVQAVDYEYGEFGEVADMLADIERMESGRAR